MPEKPIEKQPVKNEVVDEEMELRRQNTKDMTDVFSFDRPKDAPAELEGYLDASRRGAGYLLSGREDLVQKVDEDQAAAVVSVLGGVNNPKYWSDEEKKLHPPDMLKEQWDRSEAADRLFEQSMAKIDPDNDHSLRELIVTNKASGFLYNPELDLKFLEEQNGQIQSLERSSKERVMAEKQLKEALRTTIDRISSGLNAAPYVLAEVGKGENPQEKINALNAESMSLARSLRFLKAAYDSPRVLGYQTKSEMAESKKTQREQDEKRAEELRKDLKGRPLIDQLGVEKTEQSVEEKKDGDSLPKSRSELSAYYRKSFKPLELLSPAEFKQKYTTEIERQIKSWVEAQVRGWISDQAPNVMYPDKMTTFGNSIISQSLAQRIAFTKGKFLSADDLNNTSFAQFAKDYLNIDVPPDYDRHFKRS